MLIKSRLNGKTWLWINIPKTATSTTFKAIFPDKDYRDQSHNTFKNLVNTHQNKYDVFTMVRNPIDRFMSGLNHIFNVCECGQCTFDLKNPPTTEEVISFTRDMLLLKKQNENFFDVLYSNKTNELYLEVVKSIQTNFVRNITIANPSTCTRWSFIIPQSYILDGLEHARIFRYENIKTFFNFITYTLGYPVPTERYRQYSNTLINVDKNNTTLRQFLYEFYKDDFINYKYNI